MSDKKQYICLQRIRVEGKPQEIDTVVGLSDKDAKSLPDDAIKPYESPAKASTPVGETKAAGNDDKAEGKQPEVDNVVELAPAKNPDDQKLEDGKADADADEFDEAARFSDEQLEHDATVLLTIQAIGKLDKDNTDHWTASKLPQVDALNEILAKQDPHHENISAAIRDEAFDAVKKELAK